MPDYSDEYKLDSGLRESMDLTVHLAYFSTSADYQNGNVYLLFLTGEDEEGEPVEVRMSVGADWTSADGGKTITHPTKKYINRNTIYGHWLTHAIEIPELRAVLAERGGPTVAAIWDNLRLHLDLTEIKFGKNLDPQERLMPTSFLGVYEDSGTSSTTPLTTPTPSPTVSPAAPSPADVVAQAKAKAAAASNGSSPLYTEMVELAKASSTYSDFVSAALARDDVLADEELAVQVADEGGIWAIAKA